MKKLILMLFLGLMGILLLNQSSAMLSLECSDSSYVFANSAVVVNGTIKNVETNRINGTISTILTIDVEKYGKGSGGDEIIIKVAGGKIGIDIMEVEDTPLFTKEDIGVKGEFFLYNNSAGEFNLFCGEWNEIKIENGDCSVNSDCYPVGFIQKECGTFHSCVNKKCVVGSNTCAPKNNSCKEFYWLDNENRECGKKEFCGVFMYYGLQTFESKTQCLKASEDYCGKDSDCKVKFSSCSCSNGCILASQESGVDCERLCSDAESNLSITSCKCENNICVGKQERAQECRVDSDCKVSECQRKCININLAETLRYCGEKGFPDSCVCIENKCRGNKNLSNGRKAEIKIMPETASERAIERLGELNFTIELKEVGKEINNGGKINIKIIPAYELVGEKEGRMLGLFKIKGKVSIQVDAESGEVLKVGKPWWAFLASGI